MKLEKLTKEQKELMLTVRDKWINIFNNNTTFNDESVVKGIEWLYAFCGLKKPQVLIVDNPFYVQLLANTFNNKNVNDNIEDNVWNNVKYNVNDNIEDNVWNNVKYNVMNNVEDNVWNNVKYNIKYNVMYNVMNNVNWISTCDYLDYTNAGWVSFYDFFTRIGVLNNEYFNNYMELISNGVYFSVALDGVCIVSRPPKKIITNENGLLHNLDGYSVEFDGYKMNNINGKNIKTIYFDAIKNKTFKVEDFLKEENEEQKSACIEMMQLLYGDEYLIQFLGDIFKEKDTYVDKKKEEYLKGTTGGMNIGVYTLFEGVINNDLVKYIRCYCPSTDRMFFLGVDNSVANAKDAIASLYRVPRKLKNNIKHISRQGERYSTIFDAETTIKLKNNEYSCKDLEDLVSLDGDTYFELIKYEY